MLNDFVLLKTHAMIFLSSKSCNFVAIAFKAVMRSNHPQMMTQYR